MISVAFLLALTGQAGVAVLVGSVPELVEQKLSENETSTLWRCFEARYQSETVEEMSDSVLSCAKRNLYLNLVNNMESHCVDVGDGVTFVSEAEEVVSPRDLFPSGEEPSTFRGVIDAYSSFLSRRAARWDLGFLYPGLVMRIGPTMNGAGVLEFALERRLDYYDRSKLRPGQLIVRRTILPHLLGFRMNLTTLLPVILGVLLFVSKNAFVFSKLTLLLSTILAIKSFLLMQQMKPPPMSSYDVVETTSVSEAGAIGLGPRPQSPYVNNVLLELLAATPPPPFKGVNDKYDGRSSGKRNFAWEKRRWTNGRRGVADSLGERE